MLKLTPKGADAVKVTFVLSIEDAPAQVSVLGDFNSWNPLTHPLKKRANGTRSASVELPVGTQAQFKYLADDGHWFVDLAAPDHCMNEYGEVNSVLVT